MNKKELKAQRFVWQRHGITKQEYRNIHGWLVYNYGKANKCENPNHAYENPKMYEWALLKGKTYGRKRDNYWQLCKSCHLRYDDNDIARKNKSEGQKRLIRQKRGNFPIVSVKQLTEDGELITVYESQAEAGRRTGISQSNISNRGIKLGKSVGGYRWELA